jgi:hypothetical protein
LYSYVSLWVCFQLKVELESHKVELAAATQQIATLTSQVTTDACMRFLPQLSPTAQQPPYSSPYSSRSSFILNFQVGGNKMQLRVSFVGCWLSNHEQLRAVTSNKAVLETNISRLFNTARLELQRKDAEITRLRRMSVNWFRPCLMSLVSSPLRRIML